jgi:hypothetical protein
MTAWALMNTRNPTLTHVCSIHLSFRHPQGEKGDYFYVVNTGRYDVYLTGTVEPVTSYVHPALFGTSAPSLCSPRACIRFRVHASSFSSQRHMFSPDFEMLSSRNRLPCHIFQSQRLQFGLEFSVPAFR